MKFWDDRNLRTSWINKTLISYKTIIIEIIQARYMNTDTSETFPKAFLNARTCQVNNGFKKKQQIFILTKKILTFFYFEIFHQNEVFHHELGRCSRFDHVVCLKNLPRMFDGVFWIPRTCQINNWFKKKKQKFHVEKKILTFFFWPQNLELRWLSILICRRLASLGASKIFYRP